MKELINLISSFPPPLAKSIAKGLARFSSNGKVDTNYVNLFNAIRKYGAKKTDPNFYSNKVLGVSAGNNFYALKHRLKKKIISLIPIDSHTNNNSALETFDTEYLYALHQLNSARTLVKVGGDQGAIQNLLYEVIRFGLKYEIFSLQIEAYKFLKYMKAFHQGKEVFDEINQTLVDLESNEKALCTANDYYYMYIVNPSLFLQQDNPKDLENKLLEAIYELKKTNEIAGSQVIDYYISQLELEYYDQRGEYLTGLNMARNLIVSIQKSETIYRQSRLASAVSNVAYFQAKLHLYKESEESWRLAIKKAIKKSNNYNYYFLLLSQTSLAFLNGSGAKSTSSHILKELENSKNSILIGKLKLISACAKFQLGKYKETLKICSQNDLLKNSPFTWGLQVKLVQALAAMRCEKFDLADSLIQSLYKFSKETGFSEQVSKRDRLIISALNELSKNGYNTSRPSEGTLKILRELEEDEALRWKIFRHEPLAIDLLIKQFLQIPEIRKSAFSKAKIIA